MKILDLTIALTNYQYKLATTNCVFIDYIEFDFTEYIESFQDVMLILNSNNDFKFKINYDKLLYDDVITHEEYNYLISQNQ